MAFPLRGYPSPALPKYRHRDAIMSLGPRAYFRLQETSGTNAVDEVGAHTGTYTNTPTLGNAGPFQGSRCMTSVSDNVIYLQTNVAGAMTNRSFSLWYKSVANHSKRSFLFGGNWSINMGVGPTTVFNLGTANCLLIQVGGSDTSCGVYSAKNINDGVWHHIVGTFQGGSTTAPTVSTYKLYVDGAEVAVFTGEAYGPISVPVNDGSTGVAMGTIIGSYAELAIFDKVLTPQQIAWLYQRQAA